MLPPELHPSPDSSSRTSQERSRARIAERGMSLLEITIALTFVTMGRIGIQSTLVTSRNLERRTEKNAEAHQLFRRILEDVRQGDLDARLLEYRSRPTFTVGDFQVTVEFPASLLQECLGAGARRESKYQDLDGDGQVERDPTATSGSGLLPLRVTIDSKTMPKAIEYTSLVVEK